MLLFVCMSTRVPSVRPSSASNARAPINRINRVGIVPPPRTPVGDGHVDQVMQVKSATVCCWSDEVGNYIRAPHSVVKRSLSPECRVRPRSASCEPPPHHVSNSGMHPNMLALPLAAGAAKLLDRHNDRADNRRKKKLADWLDLKRRSSTNIHLRFVVV